MTFGVAYIPPVELGYFNTNFYSDFAIGPQANAEIGPSIYGTVYAPPVNIGAVGNNGTWSFNKSFFNQYNVYISSGGGSGGGGGPVVGNYLQLNPYTPAIQVVNSGVSFAASSEATTLGGSVGTAIEQSGPHQITAQGNNNTTFNSLYPASAIELFDSTGAADFLYTNYATGLTDSNLAANAFVISRGPGFFTLDQSLQFGPGNSDIIIGNNMRSVTGPFTIPAVTIDSITGEVSTIFTTPFQPQDFITKAYGDAAYSSTVSPWLPLSGITPMAGNIQMAGYNITNANIASVVTALFNRGGYSVSLAGSLGMTANYALQFPALNGAANSSLSNDGTGILTWVNFLPLDGSLAMTGNIDVGAFNIGNANVVSCETVAFVNGIDTVTIQQNPETTTYNLQLPASQGSSGEVLANNGAGGLYWVANAYLPIDGSLPMTGSLDMGGNNIVSVNQVTTSQIGATYFDLFATTGPTTYIRSATTGTGSVLFYLPPDNGSSGFILNTDGDGNTSWLDGSQVYVTLSGSVPMTGSLNFNSNNINNVGTIFVSSSVQCSGVVTTPNIILQNITSGFNTSIFQQGGGSSNQILNLPSNAGAAGNTLITDGEGVLTWGSPTDSGALQLNGSSVMTGNINAGNNSLVNVSSIGTVSLILNSPSSSQTILVANSSQTLLQSYTISLPQTQGAAGTTLINNGFGALTWQIPVGTVGTVAKFTTGSGYSTLNYIGNGASYTNTPPIDNNQYLVYGFPYGTYVVDPYSWFAPSGSTTQAPITLPAGKYRYEVNYCLNYYNFTNNYMQSRADYYASTTAGIPSNTIVPPLFSTNVQFYGTTNQFSAVTFTISGYNDLLIVCTDPLTYIFPTIGLIHPPIGTGTSNVNYYNITITKIA